MMHEPELLAMMEFSDEKNAQLRKAFDEAKNWKTFKGNTWKLRIQFKMEARPPETLIPIRLCPSCGIEIHYTTIAAKRLADKTKSKCKKCAFSGENNPFFGKHHSDESKAKIGDHTTDAWQKRNEYVKTDEYKKWAAERFSGEKNARFGHGSLKDIWIRKLGVEEGTKRWNEWRAIQSKNSSGDGNPMYGKPAPQGSGNGWSGWYKEWFFRSLLELSFMINFIERFGFEWKSGESRAFMVPYVDWKGTKRNYFPDFVLNDRYVAECKPKKLRHTPSVMAKTAAAHELCARTGMKYKVITPKFLTNDQIMFMHQAGTIRFTDRYERKFQEQYGATFYSKKNT